MTDTVGALVEGLLLQRRERADRVLALARSIRGLPAAGEPPEPTIILEVPSVPEPLPVPAPVEFKPLPLQSLPPHPLPPPLPETTAPESDPVAPYREALLALRDERDALQKRNLALYDELGRLKAELDLARATARTPSPVRADLDASFREIARLLAARRDRDPSATDTPPTAFSA